MACAVTGFSTAVPCYHVRCLSHTPPHLFESNEVQLQGGGCLKLLQDRPQVALTVHSVPAGTINLSTSAQRKAVGCIYSLTLLILSTHGHVDITKMSTGTSWALLGGCKLKLLLKGTAWAYIPPRQSNITISMTK